MSICVVDGGPCQCQPSEGCPCPGVAALHAKDSIRTREHNLLVAENRSQAAEIAALRAEVAGLREALQMWLTLHDNPAGYTGKYGKALDAAIAAQQTKIDAAATAARTALAARKGEA